MRLRRSHAQWCISLIVMIIINVHVSLWVNRIYDSRQDAAHPLSTENERPVKKEEFSPIQKPDAATLRIAPVEIVYKTVEVIRTVNRTVEVIREVEVVREVFKDVKVVHPRILSSDWLMEKSELPTFASGQSEFILGSVLERSSKSWNLHLTTFLFCHRMLQPSKSNLDKRIVHPAMRDTWRRAVMRFKKAKYLASGARRQKKENEKFYCKIAHSSSSTSYTVSGDFVPNRLTSDPNANNLVDILRCPLKDSQDAHKYADSNSSISVEILRGNISLVSFSVPWSTRKAGFLLSNPKAASQLDSWKGMNVLGTSPLPKIQKIDKLHVCVPASNQEPARSILPLYLEFVSHHLLLGADHIHLPVPFGWESTHMRKFIEIFQSYIAEG